MAPSDSIVQRFLWKNRKNGIFEVLFQWVNDIVQMRDMAHSMRKKFQFFVSDYTLTPQENESTTLITKTFIILSLPGMQRGVHWQINVIKSNSYHSYQSKSYHLIAFELVNPLLYIYFPSFESGFYF